VFGGLLNALAMIAPVQALERWLMNVLSTTSDAPVLALLFVLGLFAAPLLIIGGAAVLTRCLAGEQAGSIRRTGVRYAYALLPFGFGVWLAHYGFHLLTGALTVVPVLQDAAMQLFGWGVLGSPLWTWVGMRPGTVFPIQIGFILLGAIGSLALAYQTSERDFPARPIGATSPWAVVILLLASTAMWIVAQPMEMRGTVFAE
jgi:hypothetical protein